MRDNGAGSQAARKTLSVILRLASVGLVYAYEIIVVLALKSPAPQWLRRVLVCNPFYLVSVALLLFGCYRISLEPALFKHESAHLFFNFTSLQIYELLLVVAASFLAARRIWQDSTLLVIIENLLILVPFILISQAALINSGITWKLCLLGGLLALGRFFAVKYWIKELDFRIPLAGAALLVLAVNASLPAVYRILHE